MSGLFDTLMNLFVFAFVGVLIWLYFKEIPPDKEGKDPDSRPGG